MIPELLVTLSEISHIYYLFIQKPISIEDLKMEIDKRIRPTE
jgi:hypothetical protein